MYVSIPRIKQPIELFIVFRALGILSDKDICQYILLDGIVLVVGVEADHVGLTTCLWASRSA